MAEQGAMQPISHGQRAMVADFLDQVTDLEGISIGFTEKNHTLILTIENIEPEDFELLKMLGVTPS